MDPSMSVCHIFNYSVNSIDLRSHSDLVNIVAAMFLDTVIACDTISAFFISLVALLRSLPITWCKEYLWTEREKKQEQ
jgi:hypothetical protein